MIYYQKSLLRHSYWQKFRFAFVYVISVIFVPWYISNDVNLHGYILGVIPGRSKQRERQLSSPKYSTWCSLRWLLFFFICTIAYIHKYTCVMVCFPEILILVHQWFCLDHQSFISALMMKYTYYTMQSSDAYSHQFRSTIHIWIDEVSLDIRVF